MLGNMSKESNGECRRVGAWAVIGQPNGASMVIPGTVIPIPLTDLIGVDSSVLLPDLIVMDPVTGLIRPRPGASMLLADGMVVPVPDEWFLHPYTGKVLPIEGHVSYDPISSRLIFTADSAFGEGLFLAMKMIVHCFF